MKEIKYHVALKSTEHPHRYPNDTVYTNDRESVQFVFTLTDFQSTELSSATAKIYLFMKNGSMYQEDATVVPSSRQINYTMQGNQGKHYGQNRVQIELIIGGRTYASPVYYYTINPGLETQVAQEVMIKDWTTLTAQARAWLDDAETDEEARKLAEQGRVLAEGQREVAEAGRVSDFSSKADLAYVDTELAKKANRQQEDWITPTLLNGWTHHNAYPGLRYMKDDFGFVHLSGHLVPGEGGNVFILPEGYRPRGATEEIVNVSYNTIDPGLLHIRSDGIVRVPGSLGRMVSIHVIFRAER